MNQRLHPPAPACTNDTSVLAAGATTPDTSTAARHCASPPKVAILLGSYQGQAYLAQQLDSIAAQTHSNWEMHVSDDGSVDDTPAILEQYRRRWNGRLSVRAGPANGFSANFLSLTRHAESDAAFFCFSDQDDIWEADHLERALDKLRLHDDAVPALYCSRTQYITEDGAHMGFSTLFKRPPGFRNALVQNIGGGNTMVFNRAARNLLINVQGPVEVVSHDWWVYLLVSGAGGHVIYDDYPGVRYRQHGSNMMGQNVTIGARLARLKLLLLGRFRKWNGANLAALDLAQDYLTPENLRIKRLFERARRGNIFVRLTSLYRSGIYRQFMSDNLALWIIALLNRL